MKKRILHFVFITSIIGLLYSCANPGQLSGGPKDTEPPVIESSIPENKSINTNPKEIILIFDENIDENNIQSNMFITPYIDNPYEVKVKKNRLILQFEKSFKDNTTYTINFNNSIKDLTEKNETKNLKYIFSTGPFLDSLIIKTTVKIPSTDQPCNNCLVSLYKTNDTNTIQYSKPFYFSYTNEKGEATLENIQADTYNLYALNDNNNNFLYDKNENIGFIESSVTLDSTDKKVEVMMTKNDQRIQKINQTLNYNDLYTIILNKGIINYEIVDTSYKNLNTKHWLSEDKKIFIKSNNDINCYIISQDSVNQKDTLKLNVVIDSTHNYLHIASQQFQLKPSDNIQLQLSNLPTLITDSLLYFVSDSIIIKNIGWKLDTNRLILSINKPKNLNSFMLHIDSLAIKNNKVGCKEFEKNYKLYEETKTGIISGRINCKSNVQLQLLDNKYRIIETIDNPVEYRFEYLEPNPYQLRVILDDNENGKWDNGEFKNKILPEKIIFHTSKINLRKNWEIRDINISCP